MATPKLPPHLPAGDFVVNAQVSLASGGEASRIPHQFHAYVCGAT
jgi:hypothetical protein